MKYFKTSSKEYLYLVASLVEAWIEMHCSTKSFSRIQVASLVEAWIEITEEWSLKVYKKVASLVEAWIEIILLPCIASL